MEFLFTCLPGRFPLPFGLHIELQSDGIRKSTRVKEFEVDSANLGEPNIE